MLKEVRQASGSRQSSEDGRAELVLITKRTKTAAYLHQGLTTRLMDPGSQDGNASILIQHHDEQDQHRRISESTGRNDRPSKKESDRVHVSTCLQRDSETREYTKADNGLSHNLAPLRLLAKCTLKQSATPLLKRIL